jgi:hypothetical protein
MKRSILAAFIALTMAPVAACTGSVGSSTPGTNGAAGGSVTGPGGGASTGLGGNGGGFIAGAGGSVITGGGGSTVTGAGGGPPFQALAAASIVRKVKNLLTGLAPTDADVATVTASGVPGLQGLITIWMTDAQFSNNFKNKMVFFFRNAFQQTGFSPTDDFKPQLLQNGGFDFGPLGTGAVGDDAFARLVQNLQDSFALTAWQLVAEGRPFTDVITTQRYMMTTGLKSLYLQIEMPNDQPFSFGAGGTACTTDANCTAPMGCNLGGNVGQTKTRGTCQLAWRVDNSGTAIALTDTLTAGNPSYMTFDDQLPASGATGFGGGGMGFVNCHGMATVSQYYGYAQLFQRLLGYTPRFPFVASNACLEHASKPYFTTADMSDWTWVTIQPLAAGAAHIQPFDLPTLRTTTTLPLALPRVGFYTTPAFLALWATNDSNQHRVTANQTLLAALGQSFTSANSITPVSTTGLDPNHAVTGTDCFACHKSLDPLRNFWATQLDFNDRNDFPSTGNFQGGAANPRPTAIGGVLAFGNVNLPGANMLAFGPLLEQVMDGSGADTISRFAIAVTQKLCYFANSSACLESDPEFRRVALAFQNNNFNLPAMVRDLFSSPLVTSASDTQTADQLGTTISIARRDQMCGALSNRLGLADACALAAPKPTTAQAATLKIVSSMAADGFGRGSEIPVTPSDPTLFYRAASEMLCENVAPQMVDATGGMYTSTSAANVSSAIADMVQRIVGYPPTDPHYAQAVQILQAHYTAAVAAPASATNSLRSTFALACQSPTFLSFGI